MTEQLVAIKAASGKERDIFTFKSKSDEIVSLLNRINKCIERGIEVPIGDARELNALLITQRETLHRLCPLGPEVSDDEYRDQMNMDRHVTNIVRDMMDDDSLSVYLHNHLHESPLVEFSINVTSSVCVDTVRSFKLRVPEVVIGDPSLRGILIEKLRYEGPIGDYDFHHEPEPDYTSDVDIDVEFNFPGI